MTLHVECRCFAASIQELVVVDFEPEFLLNLNAGLSKLDAIVVRGVDGEALGMHLVNGDMEVDVVGVVVRCTHTLMVLKPQRLAERLLDRYQLLHRRVLSGAKGDQEVVSLVRSRPRVLKLNRLHLKRRSGGNKRFTIRYLDVPNALLLVLLPCDVRDQIRDVALSRDPHRYVLRNYHEI